MKYFFFILLLISIKARSNHLFDQSCQELEAQFKQIKSYKEFSPNGSEHIKGVILGLHGLNNRPSVLDEFLKKISQDLHFKAIRFGLTGHNGDLEKMKVVTSKNWRNDFYTAYCKAYLESQKKNVPLYFVAFSLGANIPTEIVTHQTKTLIEFDKLIFFAPATGLKWYTSIVKLFKLFGGEFILGSRMPKKYRANKGTSINAYQNLLNNVQQINNFPSKNTILNTKTLIIIHPKDPLISLSKLKKLYKKNNSTNVEFFEVDNKHSQLKNKYAHLIIDSFSLGETQWEEVIIKSKNFLKQDKAHDDLK